MNEWLKKLLTQVKDLWAKGSLVQKVIFIGIILLVIGAIILILTLSSTPTSVALYNVAITDEAARDKILYRLSEENIPVSVNAAGMLTVPDEATADRKSVV